MSHLDSFIGNTNIVKSVKVEIAASKNRGVRFRHTLMTGFPGTGKTTLTRLIAEEMGANFAEQDCGIVAKTMTLEKLLFGGSNPLIKLQMNNDRDGCKLRAVPTFVLLDEAHNLPEIVFQQMLKPMLDDKITCEDGTVIYIGDVTFCMATTNEEMIPDALVTRCRNNWRLDRYTPAELSLMLKSIKMRDRGMIDGVRYTFDIEIPLTPDLSLRIAERSRFNPRIAKESLAEGFYNYCRGMVEDPQEIMPFINDETLDEFFAMNGIYEDGITTQDVSYMRLLEENKKMGLAAISSYMELGKKIVEQDIEPFLRFKKFIMMVPGGRALTHVGRQFLNDFDHHAEGRKSVSDSINLAMAH